MIKYCYPTMKIQKNFVVLSLLISFTLIGFSQNKPQKKEEVPTKQELGEMIKEMQENMHTDQIIQGSAEFGSDFDLAKPSELGPVKAELKA